MFVKIHKSYRPVVAICDKELLGKKFEQDNKVIELTSSFFEGQEIDSEKLLEKIQLLADEDSTFNIVGEKSIKIALKVGIIKPEGVIKIQNIPVALALL